MIYQLRPVGAGYGGGEEQKRTKSQKTQKGARNGLQETPDRGEVRREADIRRRLWKREWWLPCLLPLYDAAYELSATTKVLARHGTSSRGGHSKVDKMENDYEV